MNKSAGWMHAKCRGLLFALAVMVLAAPGSSAFEAREYRMTDGLDMDLLEDCYLDYYYYVPCPTYSWFWGFYNWEYGDIVGTWFKVGDVSISSGQACDPGECHTLERIRVLDLGGYGGWHGCCEVRFNVYCSDEYGCPIGPSLWRSGILELDSGWNYVNINPPISICGCSVDPGNPLSGPRILVTATHGGYPAYYPNWAADNISTVVERGCDFHGLSCLPALYPRPYNSYYPAMHSGFYGQNFQYCPPLWFKDGRDTTPDATDYGYIELAWRIYLICSGPTNVEPTTWGNIKGMYR